MNTQVEETPSLRKAAPQAGKTLLRLIVPARAVGAHPNGLSQAFAAFFTIGTACSERFSPRRRLLDQTRHK
jgi:hypothetical protein